MCQLFWAKDKAYRTILSGIQNSDLQCGLGRLTPGQSLLFDFGGFAEEGTRIVADPVVENQF